MRDGIRDAGGVPLEFPIHPIQETGKRPTAALDRNLAYLGLVEVLHGYPIDGVVLTTGCDKTTPACLMGAATVNIPAIVLSGGPMLDGWWQGRLSGSGTIVWEGRKLFAEGKIGYDEFMQMVSSSAPSVGHCNTMGTATSMNSLAEALGMSLPGCAAIPAPYRERGWMAYETGKRIVGMVKENLRPSDIMTKAGVRERGGRGRGAGRVVELPDPHGGDRAPHGRGAFAGRLAAAGSGNSAAGAMCSPPGASWARNSIAPAACPRCMKELLAAGKLHGDAMTVTGRTIAENLRDVPDGDREVIRSYAKPMLPAAGYVVMSGNLFDSAVMKISVIDKDFRARFLSDPIASERVRGQGDRVRRPGGLSPPHRGPRPWRRRPVGADHPQLRPGRLSRQRRSGEHAAAGCDAEARHHDAADHGRRAAVGHVRLAVDPERVAGGGGRRRPRVAARPATASAST